MLCSHILYIVEDFNEEDKVPVEVPVEIPVEVPVL